MNHNVEYKEIVYFFCLLKVYKQMRQLSTEDAVRSEGANFIKVCNSLIIINSEF